MSALSVEDVPVDRAGLPVVRGVSLRAARATPRLHPPDHESPALGTRESHVRNTRVERSGAPALEVRGLRVRFGALTTVDGVALVVPEGHVVGLVGPNGADKSTLSNAVTGFTAYDGAVLLDGRPVDGLPAHRRASPQLPTAPRAHHPDRRHVPPGRHAADRRGRRVERAGEPVRVLRAEQPQPFERNTHVPRR